MNFLAFSFRFYRVNSSRSRSTGGSGLGLAILKAIVQTHQGKLSVQSQLGKGSTFTVQLPLNATHMKSDASGKLLRERIYSLKVLHCILRIFK